MEGKQLDIGGVIGRVFSIYGDQASVWVPVSALIIGLPAILAVVLERSSNLGLAFLATVVGFVAQFVFTGMVVELVDAVENGQDHPDAGRLLRSVIPVLGSLIVVSLVAGIATVIGFVFFIVPGLILITVWAVFAPIIVLERPGGLKSLSMSRAMVRGHGWQVFGVLVLLFILVFIVSLVFGAVGFAVSIGCSGSSCPSSSRVLLAARERARGGGHVLRAQSRSAAPRGGLEPFEPIAVPPAGIHEEPAGTATATIERARRPAAPRPAGRDADRCHRGRRWRRRPVLSRAARRARRPGRGARGDAAGARRRRRGRRRAGARRGAQRGVGRQSTRYAGRLIEAERGGRILL